MKVLTPETGHHSAPDVQLPTISFAHLASTFDADETDILEKYVYGFPYPQEEELYETGILISVFLKC